ncbi:MAG: SurA N-terminal domain-containing protein [candidate division WOR-3 bacterium]|nr:MAG: SurA N-terminal domain-containing protein [candidate division WOR-3 bacterium]
MMQTLRKNIKYVLVVVLVAFLGLIFFQWGANIFGTKPERQTDIAVINGQEIPYEMYYRYVRQAENVQKGITRDEIWQQFIDEVMWSRLLTDEGIIVSDDEIWQVIKNNPPRELLEADMLRNEQGEFDYGRYQELLRQPQSRVWLNAYAQQLREQLPKEKLRSLLSTFGWVSPYEDSLEIVVQTNVYALSYLQLPLFRARSLLQITDDELKKYYNDHPEDFMTDRMVILKYIYFDRKPSSYDTLEAREMIEDFVAQVEEGGNFLELALEASDDTSVVIEFSGITGLKPYLMDVYSQLRNDEMSGIIPAPHGFEVIQRVEENMIYKMKVNIVVSEMTRGEIFDRIMSFKETADVLGFDSTAQELEIPVRRTYPMEPDNITFPIRNPDGLKKFVEDAGGDEISGPFASLGGYYVFAVDSMIPESQPEFEEVKPRVKVVMEKMRLQDIMHQKLDEASRILDQGTSMEQLTAEDTLFYFRQQNDIILGEVLRTLGGEVAGAVMQLIPGQRSSPIVTEWAGYIIRCDSRNIQPIDSTMYLSLQMKRQARLQYITGMIFTPEEIEDFRDEFFE